jgi:hypothetical protein
VHFKAESADRFTEAGLMRFLSRCVVLQVLCMHLLHLLRVVVVFSV